jgi:hypothetical protein
MAGFSRRATEPLGGPISPLDGRGEELRLYAKGVNNEMKRESNVHPYPLPEGGDVCGRMALVARRPGCGEGDQTVWRRVVVFLLQREL